MPNPSYYFGLFKKFQVLDHVPAKTFHGSAAPSGGFDLRNPASVFGSSNRGALLGATTTPADSPLWAILNSRANGNAAYSGVTVGGTSWPTMPPGAPPAWVEFQTGAAAPKLMEVFGDWISLGKVNDVPNGVIGNVPAIPIAGPLDAGVALFACSVAGDDGIRPGTVPANYWSTSLIYLVDPATGATVNPTQLAAVSDYYLAAVVGNRGNAAGGRFLAAAGVKIEAAGWVMVWNTGMSPAVQLPALSNLDVDSTNGVYESYFMRSGEYDVVGFRLNVQTVFDGLIQAIDASGMDLGGLTSTQWVHAQGAHLCAKVLVRRADEAWPLMGDTPFTNRRIAQKNLVPFAVDVALVDPDPNIVWRNFVVGDVIQFMNAPGGGDERWGRHRLSVRKDLPAGVLRLYLAVTRRSFARWFREDALKGFKIVDEKALRGIKAPFPEHVILRLEDDANSIELPALGREFCAMSLGVEYSPKRLKDGAKGSISIVQETTVPKVDAKRRRYENETVVVGGLTLTLDVLDSRKVPRPKDPARA
jgi:hypothetical protein